MTSKWGKIKLVTHEPQASVSQMFSPHFDVFCDLLLMITEQTQGNMECICTMIRKEQRLIKIPASYHLLDCLRIWASLGFFYPACRGYIFAVWAGVRKVASANSRSIFYRACAKFVSTFRLCLSGSSFFLYLSCKQFFQKVFNVFTCSKQNNGENVLQKLWVSRNDDTR